MINLLKEVDRRVEDRIHTFIMDVTYMVAAVLFLHKLVRDTNGQGNRRNN